jgi:hypothetical protein
MNKAEIEAAIATLESWGRTIDNWVLGCAVVVAVALLLEAIFSVTHWRNDRKLKPLREQLAQLNNIELQDLRIKASNAESRTEVLRQENLKIGMALLPRRLILGDLNPWIEELGRHPKAQALIEVVPDWEASILAGDIQFVLERFGHWEVKRTSAIPLAYIDEGVKIVTLDEDRSGTAHSISVSPSVKAAFDLLERALGPPRTKKFVGVRWSPVNVAFPERALGGFDLKPNQVLILVGARPLSLAFPMMGADPSAPPGGIDTPTPAPAIPAAPSK